MVSIALLLAGLLGSSTARADCSCPLDANLDCAGPVTCDADTFNRLTHGEQDATEKARLCLIGNTELAAELTAAHVHVAALEAPSPLGYVAAFAGGVALVVGVLWVVR